MPKPNVFDQHLLQLFNDLTRIEFGIQTNDRATEFALERGKETLEKRVKKQSGDPEMPPFAFGTMSCLSVLNVFEPKVARFPYGAVRMFDQELLDLISEQERRANAQAIVIIYELMEHFLISFSGRAYYQLKVALNVREKQKFHRAFPAFARKKGLPEYYAKYAEWRGSRNSDQILKDLRSGVRSFDAICSKNFLGQDLVSYYDIISFCRHSIVHSNGRPDPHDLKSLQKWQQEWVNAMVQKSTLTQHDTILPHKGQMMSFTELVAGLAWALYKTVSTECGMQLA